MSYDRRIPEHIIQDPELTDGEKLFYGLICALVRKEGYCWATNRYLSQESGKTPRQVQRYINKFQNLSLIIVEMHTDENNRTERHIWTPETHSQKQRLEKIFKNKTFKEIPTHDMDVAPPHDMDVAPLYKDDLGKIRKEKYTKDASPSANAVYIFLLSKIEERHQNFKKGNPKKDVLEIDSMMKNDKRSEDQIRKVIEWIFSQEEGFWKKSIPRPKFLRKWFDDALSQMNEKPKMTLEERNKMFIKRVLEENPGLEKIVISYSSHIEIKNKSPYPYSIDFQENGFENRFESIIRKMELVIKWPK